MRYRDLFEEDEHKGMPVEHLLAMTHDHLEKHDYTRSEETGGVHFWQPNKGLDSWVDHNTEPLTNMGWKKANRGSHDFHDKWSHPNGCRLVDHCGDYGFYPPGAKIHEVISKVEFERGW
jgi:hypothetical protein